MQQKQEIRIDPIKIGDMKVEIVGTTSLLMEKMSDETLQGLINTMEGKGKDKKTIRDFEKEVEKKIHRTSTGKVGFPVSGFKKAIVESAPYMDGMDKKLAKSIIILGDIVPISFKSQVVNRTYGRDSGIKRSPRPIFRPEFQDWSCELKVRFNASLISPEQIIGLFKLAGFHIGIGGWTPQHSGQYGMFTIK